MQLGYLYKPRLGRMPTRGITTGASTGPTNITPSVDVSRTSGVAPLSIMFDASATTAASYTSRPFHNLEYRYDFGDETVSTWTYGAQPGVLLKNIAFGSTAAHVYESAGTFNPSVTIRYRLGDGSYDSTTYSLPSVTVTAADTEWATTKTYTYSTTTDHTGAPSGSIPVDNVTDIAAAIEANLGSGNRRHLLRAGQTFAAPTNFLVNVGGGANMVGKFGSGAKPIWNRTASVVMMNLSSGATPTTVSDWRFVDIVFEGNSTGQSCISGEGSCSQMTFLRCDLQNIHYGFTFSQSILNGLNASVPYTHALWDQMYIVDSTIYNLTVGDGPCGIFASWNRSAILGCSINNNGGGEHGCRTQFTNRQVFSNNTVSGIASGKANFSIRGGNYAGDATLTAGLYSEKNIVSDNQFVGGVSGGIMGIGPQNSFNDERGRNMIVERNLFTGSANNVNTITCAQPDITFRNNVALLSAGLFCKIEKSGLVPVPTNINFYNNTVYTSNSSGGSYFNFINCDVTLGSGAAASGEAGETAPAGSITITSKNNLVYGPSLVNDPYMHYNGGGGTGSYTTSNNTANGTGASVAVQTSNPNFTTFPPTTIAHCKPTSGYAVAGGTRVDGLYRDILGVATPTTPVIGAVED